jgi:hypothetical protein
MDGVIHDNEIMQWLLNTTQEDKFELNFIHLMIDPATTRQTYKKLRAGQLNHLDLQAMLIARHIFPSIYAEFCDEIHFLSEKKAIDNLYKRLLEEMPDADVEEIFPEEFIFEAVPMMAVGFSWEIPEDLDTVMNFLETNPLQPILEAFFIAVKDEKAPQNDELDDVELDEEEVEELPFDDEEMRSELGKLYASLNSTEISILIDACLLLCKSLINTSIQSNSKSYNNLAVLIHYLITKNGPETFAYSQETVDTETSLGYRAWNKENYEYICALQEQTNELWDMVYHAKLNLELDPLLQLAVINNYEMLVRSLKSDELERKSPKTRIISIIEFVEGIDLTQEFQDETLLENISWPPPIENDEILTLKQRSYPQLYLWRPASDENLIIL